VGLLSHEVVQWLDGESTRGASSRRMKGV